MFLFLDTNVWLSLYKDDGDKKVNIKNFEDLKRILANNPDIKILINEVIYYEFNRRRNQIISTGLKDFQSETISLLKNLNEYEKNIPDFISGYFQLEDELRNLLEKIGKIKSNIDEKIQNEKLEIDLIMDEFLKNENIIEVSDEVVNKARIRSLKGMPPGKLGTSKTIGDSINWVWLLEYIGKNEELYFLSFDNDFKNFKDISNYEKSNLDNNNFMKILDDEWKKSKGKRITFFDNFNKLNNYLEKISTIQRNERINNLIDGLFNSKSFKDTHYYVGNILELKEYLDDLNTFKIFEAMVTNKQIYWICSDEDVEELFELVFNKKYNNLTNEQEEQIVEYKKFTEEIFKEYPSNFLKKHFENKDDIKGDN